MRIEKGEDGGLPALRIVWDPGEYEDLVEDFRKNYENLENMKPENAIKLLKLHAIWQMGDGIYKVCEPKMECPWPGSSILDREFDKPESFPNEEELHLVLFGGTHDFESGLILWQLLNAMESPDHS